MFPQRLGARVSAPAAIPHGLPLITPRASETTASGHIAVGGVKTVEVSAKLAASLSPRTILAARAVLRSSTALPVSSNVAPTLIVR